MKRKWSFLSNSFEVSTRRNYKKMFGLIAQHTRALSVSDDPFVQNLYEQTLPVNEAYKEAYGNRTASGGGRKGETLRFRQLLKELYTKMIPQWEVNVLLRFPEKSPEYRAIFGKGRTGFRRGPYDVRIVKVGTLAKSLESFEGLFVIRMEVEDYYNKLAEARNKAKGKLMQVKNSAGLLETARRAAASRMYSNLGFLMGKYSDDPKLIRRFFETGKLRRRKRGKTVTGDVKQKAA